MKLYKYKSLQNFDYALDILHNERLYCSSYGDLNDPFEGVFVSIFNPSALLRMGGIFSFPGIKIRQRKTISDLHLYKDYSKICSLSSVSDDVRLWSYYADGHKGIVIEIDFSGTEEELVKVTYSEKLQNFGTTILGAPSVKEALSFKTSHWEFENEYRIIHKDIFYEIPGKISAIYTGHRISDSHLQILKKCTNERIPIIQTEIDIDLLKVIQKK